jgi:hypothetical protein
MGADGRGYRGTCGSTAASPSSCACGSRSSTTALTASTCTTRRRARRHPPGQDRHPDRVVLTELSLRGPAGGAPLHRGVHPRRRYRSGRGVSALPRRAGRALHPGGDARDRRRCRQHERLDTDQACRDRDAGTVGPHPPVTVNLAVRRPCRRTVAVGGGWLTTLQWRSRPRKPSTAGQESTTLAVNETLCNPGATTRRRPGQQDEAIERSRLRSNQPGSRQ